MTFKNFEAASRKRNMTSFGLFPIGRDLSWITDNAADLTPVTVSYASSVTFDLANGLSQYITLTGDVSSSSFVMNGGLAIDSGMQFWLHILQDGTGGWQFVFPTTVRNPAQLFPSTTASTMTSVLLEYRNSGWDFITPMVEGPTT